MIEKTLTRKYVYESPRMKVRVDDVLLSNGHKAKREIIEKPDAVCVAALTKEQDLLFVKQYRYAIGKTILELPAGKIEKTIPDLFENAKRELLEETGALGENYFLLGKYHPSEASITNTVHLYGCNVAKISKPCPDEDEILEAVKIPFDKALRMVLDNEIVDAKSQIAILKLREIRDEKV